MERTVLGVGVIGCGQLAREVHVPILGRMRGAEVVGFADPDPAARSEMALLAGSARGCADVEELLALSGLDAVIITAPSGLHAELTTAALRAGKHVYVEKPLATSVEAARRVVQIGQAGDRVAMVGLNYRFHRLYREARLLIGEGRLGRIVAARLAFTTSGGGGWRADRQRGGGALLDLASHEVDLARFVLAEEVACVFATTRSVASAGDTVALALGMRSGTPVQIVVSLAACEEASLEVFGEAGRLSLSRYRSLCVDVTGRGAIGPIGRALRSLRALLNVSYLLARRRAPRGEPSYEAALHRFVDAARTGQPASPGLVDGLRTQEVLHAAEQSAAMGQRVDVQQHG
jgi:predicted dehydrogenase